MKHFLVFMIKMIHFSPIFIWTCTIDKQIRGAKNHFSTSSKPKQLIRFEILNIFIINQKICKNGLRLPSPTLSFKSHLSKWINQIRQKVIKI